MGGKAILALLAVVAALAAVLYVTDEKPPVQQVASMAVLDGRSLTDAVRLRWQLHDRQPVEVGRAPDGRFQLQEPIVDDVSAAYLRQIVTAWDSAQMRAAPLADDDAGRASAGLAPPELVFTAQWADQPPLTIEVGAPGPLGVTRFLRVHGKIWEGGEALLESMRVGLDDLRERAVFRNAFGQVREVRVDARTTTGKPETIHVELVDGQWRLRAPVAGRAEPAEVQRFVTAVLSLRVDDFQAGPMRTPEREPAITVTVDGDHGEERLKLWLERGQLFGELPGRGVVFVSEAVQYTHAFDNAGERLRARILVPTRDSTFAEVVELVVDPGQGRGDRLRLVRDTPSAEWRLVEPVEFPAAPTPCNDALQALQMLAAREFVDEPAAAEPRAADPRFGLVPAQRLAVGSRLVHERAVTTLWLGADATRGVDTLVYACRADEPDTIVLVPKAHADTLRRPWLDYCALQILRQTAGVDRLDIERAGTTRTFLVDGDAWRLQGTAAARAEVGELVADDLVDLRGVRAVDARGPAFAQPDWTLRLMRKNADVLDTLWLWDRGGDAPLLAQRVAPDGAPAAPVAFELKQRLGNELRALWQ